MAFTIFIVEDEKLVFTLLKESLGKLGYNILGVSDFTNVCHEILESNADLVLMDIKLPYFNGYYWCSELRKVSKIPILFLSSISDELNQVAAIDLGGDDFIEKPFKMDLLQAKIRATLRRVYDFSEDTPKEIVINNVTLNLSEMKVFYKDEFIELSKNEFKILKILMEQAGQIVSRDNIINKLWEDDMYIEENTLTVNINRLRKRLAYIGCEGFIVTKKGVGYMVKVEKG